MAVCLGGDFFPPESQVEVSILTVIVDEGMRIGVTSLGEAFLSIRESSCTSSKQSLARGLEERDPEYILSRKLNFQCVVFCVTLLPIVIFCCVLRHSFPYDSSLIFARIIIIIVS